MTRALVAVRPDGRFTIAHLCFKVLAGCTPLPLIVECVITHSAIEPALLPYPMKSRILVCICLGLFALQCPTSAAESRVRAPSFTARPGSSLTVVPNWPQLPADIELQKLSSVAIDSRGFVYVAHRWEHPLLCLNPDGTLQRLVGEEVHRKSVAYDLRGAQPLAMEKRYWLHSLHVDRWDNLWVTDVGRHLIFKFDPRGKLLMTLGVDGEHGTDDKRFYQPTQVCVAPSGEIFVTDGYGNSRVVKLSAEGKFLQSWGVRGPGLGEFFTPHCLTMDADGLLYVADRENDRVQVFDQQGRFKAVWPNLHSVDGLYAAADGFIYGSAGLDHALIRLNRSGQLLDVWAEPGMFTYPHGICVDSAGNIYAAETKSNRLLKLRRANATSAK